VWKNGWMKTEYDVKGLLDSIGGKVDAQALLAAENCHVTMKAIDKWVLRRSMPSYAIMALIVAASKYKGITLDVPKFWKKI